MSISSLVLHARPEMASAASAAAARLPGVEVHAETPAGALVVTVDLTDDGAALDTISALRALPGVLSTSLVYSQMDRDPVPEETQP